MKTLTMTKGLPGSGKSTWALEMVAANPSQYKRVNKDDLRAMLDGGKWSRDNEKFVLKMRDHIAIEALQAGKHVIIDDTGFAEFHEVNLRALAGTYGAQFQIKDFTNVSIETCIERDLKRQHSVGEAVIRKMWRQYLAPKPLVIEYDPKLPSCVICDIDGTVAKMTGRSPYDYSQVHTDAPHTPIVDLVKSLIHTCLVIFVSGRKTECREATKDWLGEHVGYREPLFMRSDGDDRDDRIVKEEIYRREIEGKYNVRFVLDDRDRVVRMWRSLGLTVLQVAEGDF